MTIMAAGLEISGHELKKGMNAPDFEMQSNGGGNVSLKELKGKKVVLYFYPKDDTPGCTIEANDFSRLKPEFEKAGAVIIGVSKDSLQSHDKFKAKHCLSFDLATDENGSVCEAYNVWAQKNMYGKKYFGIERATFLIDEAGVIREIWRKVKVDGHAEEVLSAIKAM